MTEAVIVYRSQMEQLRDEAFVSLLTAEWAFPAICGVVIACVAFALLDWVFLSIKKRIIRSMRQSGHKYQQMDASARKVNRTVDHAHWIISAIIGCVVFWFMM